MKDSKNIYDLSLNDVICKFYDSTKGFEVDKDHKGILQYLGTYHIISDYTLHGVNDKLYEKLVQAKDTKDKCKVKDLGPLYSYVTDNSDMVLKNITPSYKYISQLNIVRYALYDGTYFKQYGNNYGYKAAEFVLDNIVQGHINNQN